jgi:poly-gamma-glutamate synthase PgsB/CapB
VITTLAAGVLGGLAALGLWERHQRDLAHAAIPIRIHVNGTRGKSTVTRLIAAALRLSGRRVLAKTTGTAARLILPDGSERPIVRRAPASIREQLWLLRQARRLGVEAVVVECMAIDPALQATSEREMLRATLAVVTNARPDHGDLMGVTSAEVAEALSAMVPDHGVLVLGPTPHAAPFEAHARRTGTRIVTVTDLPASDMVPAACPAWFRENVAIALAATRELGIPDAVAWPAMAAAAADPGALSQHPCRMAGRTVTVVDASAANDPESLGMIVNELRRAGHMLYVFNHRMDRPVRLRQFADAPLWQHAGASVLITGDTPDYLTRRQVSRRLGPTHVTFVTPPDLARAIRAHVASDAAVDHVIICGNTKHMAVDALLQHIAEA